VERSTGSRDAHLVFRGQTRRIAEFPEKLSVPSAFFRAAHAIYREGLNSVNPYYALLCFYRVIEGCAHFTGKARLLARRSGLDVSDERLVLEDIDDIGQDFPNWIGKTCQWVAGELYRAYRVPVAHGLTMGEVLHAADQVDQEGKYWKAVPIARQVARKLLFQSARARERLGADPIQELDES
jgi:hypothetical protein